MKVLREDSDAGIMIQEVENFLNERGVKFTCLPYGKIGITIKDKVFVIKNDMGDYGTSFPRFFDEEKLVIDE